MLDGKLDYTCPPTAVHVDATPDQDAGLMRFPVAVLMGLAAYFVWASTFADAVAAP